MLEIVHGDILEQEADAIVVTYTSQERELSELTARIYNAAGYENMMTAYQAAKLSATAENDEFLTVRERAKLTRRFPGRDNALTVPSIVVTPGFNLKAKHAIHVCFTLSNGRDLSGDSEPRMINHGFYYGYYHALECAFKKLGAKSIAIPFDEFSRTEGEHVINSWIKYNTPSPRSGCMLEDGTFVRRRSRFDSSKIFLVIPVSSSSVIPAALPVAPPAPVQEKIVVIQPPRKAPEPVDYDDAFAEDIEKYEKKYDNARKRKSESKLREYNNKKCIEYLERIPNAAELANILGIHPSNITRYKNYFWGSKNKSKPSPKMIVALSILIGLNGYERYEFFRCALGKYPYDSDIYNQTEMIIRKGIKSFNRINKELREINPEFDLTKNKNETPKKPPTGKSK